MDRRFLIATLCLAMLAPASATVGSAARPVARTSGAGAHSTDPMEAILQVEAQRLPPRALAKFVTAEQAAVRARAARALGRLRTSSALAPLEKLAADPDPTVRFEAAFALGQTPGAGHAILDRLALERDPKVRATLCEALGKKGDAEAIPVLLAALRERPPAFRAPELAPAAAVALGRMAMRRVAGVDDPEVVALLLEQLGRLDVHTRQSAAFALGRIAPAQLSADLSDRLFAAAADQPDPVAQAFLVRATTRLDAREAQAALYARTAADPDSGVRIATARAAAITGWTGLTRLLSDPSIAVRRAAIEAVGRIPALDRKALLAPIVAAGDQEDAARAFREQHDPRLVLAADALAALCGADLVVDPSPWLEADRPEAIRAAAAACAAPDRLLDLATSDPSPRVRTAAAIALTNLPNADEGDAATVDTHALLALLQAEDATVRSIAAERLVDSPTSSAEGPLIDALTDARLPDLLAAGGQALAALYRGPHPRVRRPDPRVRHLLPALLHHADRQVRQAGVTLARALGQPPSSAAPSPVHVPLDQVATLRSARIITNRGEVVIELFPDQAPITVWNFARLADSGFYNGLCIHRVVPDFVVQDGDPRGDGTGGPDWSIPDEINPLSYTEGTVGMALSGPDTGGSQWFVTLSPQPHLDGEYTVFGHVTAGMAVLRELLPGDTVERIVIERTPVPDPATRL